MDKNNENANFIEKKHFSLSIIFLTVITMTLFIITYFTLNNRISNMSEKNITADKPVFNESITAESVENSYMIKEFEDKIGVFKNGDFQYYLDVYIFTLPEKEQKLLNQGIVVSSEQELFDILSSYY